MDRRVEVGVVRRLGEGAAVEEEETWRGREEIGLVGVDVDGEGGDL